ncbi:hypothetical protein [Actinoplanes sp. NPDC051411]|uniref:hypothetical protein n=1 Tax=Actinoplanes sp. NPDC051411 TaxID=3155522 RepID=UPI003417A847
MSSDKLLVLLDDPESREMMFALEHSYPGGLHGLAASRGQVLLTDVVVGDVAAVVESEPAEVARQLRQLLPDLLDAVCPGGQMLPAPELARLMRIDIVLDEDEAGPFGE